MAPLTWFITGCSSGFGEELVRQLRAAGDNVIATGRNADVKLAHLKDTGAKILDLDVTKPSAEIEATVKEAWGLYDGGVDVVVNNAGYVLSGLFEELTEDAIEASMRTMFLGPVNISRAFLPLMRARGTGTFVFISSMLAWAGGPTGLCYTAGKAALERAADSLAAELAVVAPGLKVLMIEPGFVSTPLKDKTDDVPERLPEYAGLNAFVRAARPGLFDNSPTRLDKVVERIIELVRGTGHAEGKAVPLRVPLGSDALVLIRKQCNDMLAICDEWESVAKSVEG